MGATSRYLRERFPLVAVSVLALGTAVFLVGVSTVGPPETLTHAVVALITVTFVAFLLRQRVTDEFKDRGHDDLNYPNRPVQRGAIPTRTLIRMGIVAFVVEVAGVIIIAAVSGRWESILAYFGVVVYSALTAVEFFAPRWIGRHFTVYFLSHQVIFVFFVLWCFVVFAPVDTTRFVAGATAFILVMAALEIMRKFEIRRDPRGQVVKDTYVAVWGRSVTVGILASVFVASGTLLGGTIGLPVAMIGVTCALGLVVVRNSDRAVQGTTILGFFALGVAGYLS